MVMFALALALAHTAEFDQTHAAFDALLKKHEQLDDQGRVFFGQAQKNRVDAGARTIYLSPIFKWFSDDFEKKSGSVLKFVEPYLPEKDRQALAKGGFKIKYTDYDWSLNDQARKL